MRRQVSLEHRNAVGIVETHVEQLTEQSHVPVVLLEERRCRVEVVRCVPDLAKVETGADDADDAAIERARVELERRLGAAEQRARALLTL